MRERTQTLTQPMRPMLVALCTMAAFLMATVWAHAGQLGLGNPQVNGDTVTVPVVLDAHTSGDVSSLDFRVRYDPSQLRPVMAQPGPSARNADKDVIGNERGPGEFSVVLMGLNRNTVADGEVANITFERIGQGNAADLRITQTTLASPDALEIPSRGSSRTINFDGSPSAPSQEEQSPQDQQQADPRQADTASQPATGDQSSPGTTPGQTQTAQTDAGGPIGGPAAPIAPGGAPSQQVGGATPGTGGVTAGDQQRTADAPVAGDTRETQRQLQGAIASADAARSSVDAPAVSQGGQPGAPGDAGSPGQGAVEGSEGQAGGQTVDAHVQVAQVRPTAEAGQAARGETSGASPATAATSPAQNAAPMLPLLVAIGVSAVAVLGLFVVRKKLFA